MKHHKELTVCTRCGRRNWHEHTRCSWCNGQVQTQAERFMGYVFGSVAVIAIVALVWGLSQWRT